MDGCVAQDITILQVALGFFVLHSPTSVSSSHPALAFLLKITRAVLEVFARSPWKSGHQVNYFLLLLLVMLKMNSPLHMGRRPLPAVLISWAYCTCLGGSQQPAWQWGPIYVNMHNSLFFHLLQGVGWKFWSGLLGLFWAERGGHWIGEEAPGENQRQIISKWLLQPVTVSSDAEISNKTEFQWNLLESWTHLEVKFEKTLRCKLQRPSWLD